MATLISRSPEETIKLGQEWGRAAQPGWVFGLSGDLGAGKTQLVKGIALGLGIADRVHSPTFTLMIQYGGGRLPLVHLDLYRLETRAQFESAGIEEQFFQPDAVLAIEWFDHWPFSSEQVARPTHLADRLAAQQKPVPGSPIVSATISRGGSDMTLAGPAGSVPSFGFRPRRLRTVTIESLNETDRRITYADSGA